MDRELSMQSCASKGGLVRGSGWIARLISRVADFIESLKELVV
jgi:hypothetical protein